MNPVQPLKVDPIPNSQEFDVSLRAALVEYLQDVDIHELVDRISKFRELNFKKMSVQEVHSSIKDVLLFEGPGRAERYIHLAYPYVFNTGSRFLRIRRLESKDRGIPLRGIVSEADVWEAPAHVARAGRLNRDGEGLLYTSQDGAVAMEEMRVADGELVPIIVYEAIEPITVLSIGDFPPEVGLSSEEKLKLRIIMDFVRHEFTREVGVGTEHLYKISSTFASQFFFRPHSMLPSGIAEGWNYPSVARKGGINTCFHPALAKRKLSLQGFILATVKIVDGKYSYKPLSVAHGFDRKGNFIYHPTFGEVSKRIFPEIGR
jgi:hypothetical protein